MAKDGIKELIREWAAIQADRQAKMKLNNVRVQCGQQNFLGRVKIDRELISLIPMDHNIPIMAFSEHYLNGCLELGATGILLRQRIGRPDVKVYFRTEAQRNRALARVRALIGDESTSAETSSSSSQTDDDDQ